MSDDSKLGWRIKQQIRRFAGSLSEGLHAARRRLGCEMLYGIQASEDVKVSNVARSLNEPIALIKTENRLCRNLASEDLTDHVNRYLCWHGPSQVRRDTVLAVDLGGDRPALFKYVVEKKMQWVIRVNDKRPLILGGGKRHSARRAAGWCKTTIERTIEVERKGRRQRRTVHLGAIPVQLPAHPRVELWLVVIRGLVEHPILLLTNVRPPDDREHAEWIMDVYLTRWKADETYRWLKQSYHLEDLRVRSCTAIRNMYPSVAVPLAQRTPRPLASPATPAVALPLRDASPMTPMGKLLEF